MATTGEPGESSPPRFAPDRPLPPYAYVPKRFPHPLSDPRGHSFGQPPPQVVQFHPDRWSESEPFLFGVDLFNFGYYWEAHETWESIWRAAKQSASDPESREPGTKLADFMKGLIKLAASGVKAREGSSEGMSRHARRAAELFRLTRERAGPHVDRFLGLPLGELIARAGAILDAGEFVGADEEAPVKVVFPWRLEPK